MTLVNHLRHFLSKKTLKETGMFTWKHHYCSTVCHQNSCIDLVTLFQVVITSRKISSLGLTYTIPPFVIKHLLSTNSTLCHQGCSLSVTSWVNHLLCLWFTQDVTETPPWWQQVKICKITCVDDNSRIIHSNVKCCGAFMLNFLGFA